MSHTHGFIRHVHLKYKLELSLFCKLITSENLKREFFSKKNIACELHCINVARSRFSSQNLSFQRICPGLYTKFKASTADTCTLITYQTIQTITFHSIAVIDSLIPHSIMPLMFCRKSDELIFPYNVLKPFCTRQCYFNNCLLPADTIKCNFSDFLISCVLGLLFHTSSMANCHATIICIRCHRHDNVCC